MEKKKELAVKTLGWDLEKLPSFDMMDLLFNLRDQMGHGRPYKLSDTRYVKDKVLKREGPITIPDEKYTEIYRQLAGKGVLPLLNSIPPLNIDMFLVQPVSIAFYEHGIIFLRSFFGNIRLTSGMDMRYAFENALK